MCFSPEVSLATLIIGIAGSFFAYGLGKPDDKIIALFLGYVALMQGIEWLLWNHQVCDEYHKNISITGSLLNASQPVILGLLTLIISPRNTYKDYISLIVCLYSCISILYLLQYTNELQCTTPSKDDPHLVWNWTILPYYYKYGWLVYISTVVIICILGMPTFFSGVLFGSTFVISMLLSLVLYKRQDMGAMWCFISAFGPFLYYIYRVLGYPI